MARPKKPTYEFIPSRNEYRKRIKGPDGKYIALYAQTPDELTEKVALAQRQIEEAVYRRENPTVREYAEKWLTMQASSIRVTTLADYTSKVKIYIIEPLGDRYMQEITPDDVKMAITKAASKSASIYRSVQMLYKLIFTSAEQSKIIDESPCKNLNPKGGKAPKENSQIAKEIAWSLHYYGDLKSAMALCYDRVALYSREDSGLRITFDTNIRFREENTDLRQGDDGQLLLEPGETLMEIKAGGGLPTWLTDMLSRFRIYPASFSKYASAYNTHGTHIVHAS